MHIRLRRYLILTLVGMLALGLAPAASFGQQGGFQNLQPGERADLDEEVPVNFVFVGYDQDDVDRERFLAGLPEEYKPVVRSEYFYNESVEESLLGLNYTYDYNVRYADAAYEERLFGYLSEHRQARGPDGLPEAVQRQPEHVLRPPGGEPQHARRRASATSRDNHHIDASAVEEWLAANPPGGVNTERNTVFFINWWGDGQRPRAGFKHHVYTKTNEPDPDTGFNFGREADSRKLIAWGGTTRRGRGERLGAARAASGSTTSRPAPTLSPTTGTSTTRTSRGTA